MKKELITDDELMREIRNKGIADSVIYGHKNLHDEENFAATNARS
jgi:hypothetical protein